MDTDYQWYSYPQEVPEKIIALFGDAQNKLK
jgi:hypothetical protein